MNIDKIKNMNIGDKADLASKAVWEKLLNKHRKTGEPIISWKNNKVVYLSPYDLKEIDSIKAPAVGEKQAEYLSKNIDEK